ncbi:MAG TPA: phosphotransferase family protein [Chloroflexi bacterium]|nr:phosphotransferase family protein [Chloroflexota bacterium]
MSDAVRPPRPGEELDLARLEAYLKEAIPGLEGRLEVLQFPSGHSNLTYLLRMGETEMVLRRPPRGKKPKSGHDMHREWVLLNALYGAFPVPRPLAYCDDPAVLGAPFYVMERLHGLILRREPPPDLDLPPERVRLLCERLIDTHRRLHALDYRTLGLGDFGHPEGYVQRQVQGWARRYRDARTPNVPDFEDVIAWLEANLPPERGAALIHNDYRFDNVVFEISPLPRPAQAPDTPSPPLVREGRGAGGGESSFRVVGVLDWELATVGDPLMDLGASLAYWVQADDPPEMQAIRLGPTHLPGAFTRREVVARYIADTDLTPDDLRFYFVYGLFRLAGIAQQIYYRYYHGQTRDERFRHFDKAVAGLERAAKRAMEGWGL